LTEPFTADRGVEQFPVGDVEFHELPAGVPRECDVLLPLQVFQRRQGLPLVFHAEPLRNLREAAYPLARSERVACALDPAAGRPEVGVAAQGGKIKKTGTSACMEVSVGCKSSDEVAVDAASGVVYELFYF